MQSFRQKFSLVFTGVLFAVSSNIFLPQQSWAVDASPATPGPGSPSDPTPPSPTPPSPTPPSPTPPRQPTSTPTPTNSNPVRGLW